MTDYVYKSVRRGRNGDMLSKVTFDPYTVKYKIREVSMGLVGSPIFVYKEIPLDYIRDYDAIVLKCEYGKILPFDFQLSTMAVEELTLSEMKEFWSVDRKRGDVVFDEFTSVIPLNSRGEKYKAFLVDWVKPIEIISGEN